MIHVKSRPRSRRCWVSGLRPEVLLGLLICRDVAVEMRRRGLRLTSVTDSLHSRRSLHYVGQAVDFTTIDPLAPAEKPHFKAFCDEMLGPDFDLVLEGEGTPNEHWHLEFQPERP